MKTDFNLLTLFSNPNNISIAKSYDRYDNVLSIDLEQVENGYHVDAVVRVRSEEFQCSFSFDEEYSLTDYNCECIWCRDGSPCAHIGAVLLKLNQLEIPSFPYHYTNSQIEEEKKRQERRHQQQLQRALALRALETNDLIKQNKEYYHNQVSSSISHEKYNLTAILNEDDDVLYLDYKIGNAKKYIIKDVDEFLEHIENKDQVKYGKYLQFVHTRESFTDEALKQIAFLERAKIAMNKVNPENYFFSFRSSLNFGRYVYIRSEFLDDFYDVYKELGLVHCLFKDIDYTIKASLVKEQEYYVLKIIDENQFYFGKQYIYFISTFKQLTKIQRIQMDLNEKSFDILLDLFENPMFIKEEDLHDFYKYIWAPMQNYFDLTCDFELGQSPYTFIKIYGDINENEQIYFKIYYEDENQNHIHAFQNDTITTIDQDIVEAYLRQQCHQIDEKNGCVYFDSYDEKTYEFMHTGIEFLQQYSEIYISEALKKMGRPVHYHIQVGVKVDHDLLSLNMESTQIPQMEIAEVLSKYRRKKKFHRLKSGELLYLESPDLEELSKFMDEYHINANDIQNGSLTLNKNRVFALDNNATELQHIQIERDESFQKLIQQFHQHTQHLYPLTPYYNQLLRDYQKEGYQWLRTLYELGFNGVLADDMGLGKTLQVIALLDQLETDKPSLVVCPSSLIYNWEDEVHKFSQTLPVTCIVSDAKTREMMIHNIHDKHLYVTSYDYIRRDIELYDAIEFEYVILDESQYIKNQKTKNATSVKQLHALHKLALSGTPIENSLAELWSVFDFLMPQYLYNYHYFQKKFETDIVKNQDQKKIQQLQKMVSPFILRRNKKDVLLELPDKIEKTQLIPFTQQESELYFANLAQINTQLQEIFQMEKVDKIVILSMLTKLRQICCEPRMIYDNIYQSSSKMKACMDLICNYKANHQQVLLFSSFTKVFDLMEEELKLNGIRYFILTGGTSKETRRELVQRFQEGEADVFLISLKAGGTGLNLTKAQAVIHYDPWWNISAQNQATDRAYRIGQHHNVMVHQLIMKESIEEKIQILQAKKKELADMFVENSEGNISSLSTEDLKALFAM
ncbi:DEAD/DEAH box helicase [Massilimicrobiota timonensis]|uniref:DEAD/DEAH box helicase n=1 Tax=Massilimicrobiota timonensis TaxID=1776392 RepID=A0ABT7UJR6_9FIRM|nr:DEAD/DEAH box helicase [Massilimicrobiota timonensis]MDM8196202.1 DEAD/DEAH box helicase [Massilimicrobiota timonensis]